MAVEPGDLPALLFVGEFRVAVRAAFERHHAERDLGVEQGAAHSKGVVGIDAPVGRAVQYEDRGRRMESVRPKHGRPCAQRTAGMLIAVGDKFDSRPGRTWWRKTRPARRQAAELPVAAAVDDDGGERAGPLRAAIMPFTFSPSLTR